MEIEEVTGYTYTHWDCPCGEVNQEESDKTNEEVTCEACGGTYLCAEVR